MNKADLIEKISTDADISKKQAGLALDSFTNAATRTLKKVDTVTLIGFGAGMRCLVMGYPGF